MLSMFICFILATGEEEDSIRVESITHRGGLRLNTNGMAEGFRKSIEIKGSRKREKEKNTVGIQ